MKFVRLGLKVLLPLVVLAVCALLAVNIVKSREAPQRRAKPVAVTQVEVLTAQLGSYQIIARSQGTIQPRTQGTLIPEIAGRVVKMSASLRSGGFFEVGEVLLELDPREYEAAAIIARADLTQAQAKLAEEIARAVQAEREWRRLGEQGTPDALVLRKPQVASARAAVSGARARLSQRQLDLERTRIVAPYAGRVLEKNVDIGQYVTSGTVMARIYAVDYVEIRLPLSDSLLQFVAVPEIYRQDDKTNRAAGPPVLFHATMGSTRHEWRGRLVRAEGSIDTKTRQLYVIAQVDDPYGSSASGRAPLKIGQFVEAEIEGTRLSNVYVLPRGALRAGGQVLLVDQDSLLHSQDVEVIWTDASKAVINGGLNPGDRVVTTALGEGLTGTPVRIAAPDGDDKPSQTSGQASNKARSSTRGRTQTQPESGKPKAVRAGEADQETAGEKS